jgi:hypothetical protein
VFKISPPGGPKLTLLVPDSDSDSGPGPVTKNYGGRYTLDQVRQFRLRVSRIVDRCAIPCSGAYKRKAL